MSKIGSFLGQLVNNNDVGGGDKHFYYCKKSGHLEYKCPNRKKEMKNLKCSQYEKKKEHNIDHY